MRVALYARVSTTRQAQAQTIEQQLNRLMAHVEQQGWKVEEQQTFRDDGFSGASLNRPGSAPRPGGSGSPGPGADHSSRPAGQELCASGIADRGDPSAWLPGAVPGPTHE